MCVPRAYSFVLCHDPARGHCCENTEIVRTHTSFVYIVILPFVSPRFDYILTKAEVSARFHVNGNADDEDKVCIGNTSMLGAKPIRNRLIPFSASSSFDKLCLYVIDG